VIRPAFIVVWLAIQLCFVGEPPLGRDAWRETDGLMVGRNFCREDARLWLPRIDARGDGSGIAGMELPLLPYTYGMAGCAGLNEVVVGRLVTVAFALVAALALFRLATSFLPRWGALLALGLFLFSPLIVHYGHALQPDVPALALALFGLACLQRGLDTDTPRWRISAALGFALGMLVKLPVIVFGLPAAVMLVAARGWRELFQPRWLLWAAATLMPTIAWYAYARSLQERYGYAHFRLGTSVSELAAAWTSAAFYERIAGHAIDFYLLSPFGIVAVLGALVYRRGAPAWLLATGVATAAYFFACGDSSAHHYYYGIVAVPFVALAAAWTTVCLLPARLASERLALCVIAIAVVHGILRTRGWRPNPKAVALAFGVRTCLDDRPADEPITLYSRDDPTLFWFVDKKGWLARAGDAPHGPSVIDKRRFDSGSYAEQAARLAAAGFVLHCENDRAAVFISGGP
jgi:hypothetical protein